jgi:Holliday junction resolvase
MRSRVPTDKIVSLYAELGSCKKVADRVGFCPQSVHERLVKAGAINHAPCFTEEDDARIRSEYVVCRDAGRLATLAASMGRQKTSVCRRARVLGLTDRHCRRTYSGKWKYMEESDARKMFDDFRRSRLGLRAYCAKQKLDDLGFWRTMKRFFPDEWDHVIELKWPKQTFYRLGQHVEYTVRDLMKSAGYFVMRSPGSRSPVDLVAIRRGEVVFVQCKRGGCLPVREWNELFSLAVSVGAVPVLASRPTGRGIVYMRLTGSKDGSRHRQPFVPWAPTMMAGREQQLGLAVGG